MERKCSFAIKGGGRGADAIEGIEPNFLKSCEQKT